VYPRAEHRAHKGLNNRAENSHQPTRQRERARRRFKTPDHTQRFLEPFGPIRQHFCPSRHLLPAAEYRAVMVVRRATWDELSAGALPQEKPPASLRFLLFIGYRDNTRIHLSAVTGPRARLIGGAGRGCSLTVYPRAAPMFQHRVPAASLSQPKQTQQAAGTRRTHILDDPYRNLHGSHQHLELNWRPVGSSTGTDNVAGNTW
jgi:putative transposase